MSRFVEADLMIAASAGAARTIRNPPSELRAAAAALDPCFVARFLAGMAPEVAARFDARQLFAVQQAFGPWRGRERRRGWHWRVPIRWRGRHWLLSLAPLDEEGPPPDRRAAALRAATRRGMALGLLIALAAGGAALLMVSRMAA
jgi:hypothetical protein